LRRLERDQRGLRVARDVGDQAQQLLADIVVTSVVVGFKLIVNKHGLLRA
jgi:hypothetical protein